MFYNNVFRYAIYTFSSVYDIDILDNTRIIPCIGYVNLNVPNVNLF